MTDDALELEPAFAPPRVVHLERDGWTVLAVVFVDGGDHACVSRSTPLPEHVGAHRISTPTDADLAAVVELLEWPHVEERKPLFPSIARWLWRVDR